MPECCLLLSKPWFIACFFHPSKGTPNVFSFVENSEGAWEILLCLLREKQHIASSYNQGKIANSQTQPPSIWKLPGSTGKPTLWSYSSPNVSGLRKATLHISHLDISSKYCSQTYVLPHALWAKYWHRQIRLLESHSKRVLLRREVWYGLRHTSFPSWR